MKNLDQAKEGQLSKYFIQETKKFSSYVYERPEKMLQNKKSVSGRMLMELLTSFITAMKNGCVPCIEDAITVMSKQENEKRKKDAIDNFRAELGKLEVPYKSKTELLEWKFSIQTSILIRLNSELLFDEKQALEISAKEEMEKLFKDFEKENDRQLYELCLKRITEIYNEEMKRNIESKVYLVSGGYEKYKNDMQNVMEKYESQPELEKIDHLQLKRAKSDFQYGRLKESEAIMAADKAISKQEINEQQTQLKEKLEAEFKETREKEEKRLQSELEKQTKRYEEEMAAARREQEKKEQRDTLAFFEEKMARRDEQIQDMLKALATLNAEKAAASENSKASSCSVS